MKVFFIVNPVAGKGKAQDLVPMIEKVCISNKVEFQIRISSRKGEATELAREAMEQGYKKIIAVGGDGTVNEVINGIAGSDAALGVLPGGSGNDFIRSIGNHRNPYTALFDIIHGDIRTMDVGLCNGRYFINIGSVGLDAEVVIRTEKAKRFFSGSLAYIVSALYTIFTYKGWNMEIKIDEQIIRGKTLLTAIANGKYYGGGVMPAPEANINDGYFDICSIKHMTKLKMFFLFPKYMKGKHSGIKEVQFFKGKTVRITCDTPLALNLDGEIMKEKKAEFRLIHNGIRVIFPKDPSE